MGNEGSEGSREVRNRQVHEPAEVTISFKSSALFPNNKTKDRTIICLYLRFFNNTFQYCNSHLLFFSFLTSKNHQKANEKDLFLFCFVFLVLVLYSKTPEFLGYVPKSPNKKNLYTVSKYYIQHIVLQTNYKNRFSIFKYIFTVLNIYHTDHSNRVGN